MLVNLPITSGVFDKDIIMMKVVKVLHKAVQALSTGHMPHKLGVLGFHVYVQQVHLQ